MQRKLLHFLLGISLLTLSDASNKRSAPDAGKQPDAKRPTLDELLVDDSDDDDITIAPRPKIKPDPDGAKLRPDPDLASDKAVPRRDPEYTQHNTVTLDQLMDRGNVDVRPASQPAASPTQVNSPSPGTTPGKSPKTKVPCDLCGKEYLPQGMTTHRNSCRRKYEQAKQRHAAVKAQADVVRPKIVAFKKLEQLIKETQEFTRIVQAGAQLQQRSPGLWKRIVGEASQATTLMNSALKRKAALYRTQRFVPARDSLGAGAKVFYAHENHPEHHGVWSYLANGSFQGTQDGTTVTRDLPEWRGHVYNVINLTAWKQKLAQQPTAVEKEAQLLSEIEGRLKERGKARAQLAELYKRLVPNAPATLVTGQKLINVESDNAELLGEVFEVFQTSTNGSFQLRLPVGAGGAPGVVFTPVELAGADMNATRQAASKSLARFRVYTPIDSWNAMANVQQEVEQLERISKILDAPQVRHHLTQRARLYKKLVPVFDENVTADSQKGRKLVVVDKALAATSGPIPNHLGQTVTVEGVNADGTITVTAQHPIHGTVSRLNVGNWKDHVREKVRDYQGSAATWASRIEQQVSQEEVEVDSIKRVEKSQNEIDDLRENKVRHLRDLLPRFNETDRLTKGTRVAILGTGTRKILSGITGKIHSVEDRKEKDSAGNFLTKVGVKPDQPEGHYYNSYTFNDWHKEAFDLREYRDPVAWEKTNQQELSKLGPEVDAFKRLAKRVSQLTTLRGQLAEHFGKIEPELKVEDFKSGDKVIVTSSPNTVERSLHGRVGTVQENKETDTVILALEQSEGLTTANWRFLVGQVRALRKYYPPSDARFQALRLGPTAALGVEADAHNAAKESAAQAQGEEVAL